jgi:hypothetical protein
VLSPTASYSSMFRLCQGARRGLNIYPAPSLPSPPRGRGDTAVVSIDLSIPRVQKYWGRVRRRKEDEEEGREGGRGMDQRGEGKPNFERERESKRVGERERG